MSRSRGIVSLLPPSANPSGKGRGIGKPSPPAGEGRERGRLRSKQGSDFEILSGSKGFTIIELVIALSIIVILIAYTAPIGARWLTDYRLSEAVRSLSNSVFMARMRGIENRAVITITSSATTTGSPFSTTCPGVIFTTNVDHGLSKPNPVLSNALVLPPPLPAFWNPIANCRCVKNLGTAPSTTPTPGDTVMISGLDHTISMNGTEFEVLTVPANNQLTVQHAFSASLGDTTGPDTKGTVRNLIAPGRLRLIPAVATANPTNDNEESFSSASYTVKEEGSSIVFRYDANKFQVTFFAGNPPIPSANLPLDPASTSNNYAEIRFDNHGFPSTTMAYDSTSSAMITKTISTNTTILVAEMVPTASQKTPLRVQYLISPTGKVNTMAWED